MLTYSILFINTLYYKISYIYIHTHESILIRAGSRVLIESSRVYTSLHRLIIEFDFVFTSNSFNNRFKHESSLFEPISSKLMSSSACLYPYL